MNRTPLSFDHNEPRPVNLPNDYGNSIAMVATMVAEDIHFSTDSGVLTVEKLYRTQEGRLGYGIVAASSDTRERRAYLLDEQGDTVLADNGSYVVELPVADMFELLAMALQAEDALQTVGDHALMLQAVNEE